MDKVIEAMARFLSEHEKEYCLYEQVAQALLNLRYDCKACGGIGAIPVQFRDGEMEPQPCENCKGTGKGSRMLAIRKPNQPKIVCLCGSTRFGKIFNRIQRVETMKGNIVLTIGCNMKLDVWFRNQPEKELENIKSLLDELHLRKIDLADEVLILNVGGYIGESTANEIKYAQSEGKVIRYLETKTAMLSGEQGYRRITMECSECKNRGHEFTIYETIKDEYCKTTKRILAYCEPLIRKQVAQEIFGKFRKKAIYNRSAESWELQNMDLFDMEAEYGVQG